MKNSKLEWKRNYALKNEIDVDKKEIYEHNSAKEHIMIRGNLSLERKNFQIVMLQ